MGFLARRRALIDAVLAAPGRAVVGDVIHLGAQLQAARAICFFFGHDRRLYPRTRFDSHGESCYADGGYAAARADRKKGRRGRALGPATARLSGGVLLRMSLSEIASNTDSRRPTRTAVVPAAGWGTRLRPLSEILPKEMLPDRAARRSRARFRRAVRRRNRTRGSGRLVRQRGASEIEVRDEVRRALHRVRSPARRCAAWATRFSRPSRFSKASRRWSSRWATLCSSRRFPARWFRGCCRRALPSRGRRPESLPRANLEIRRRQTRRCALFPIRSSRSPSKVWWRSPPPPTRRATLR